MPSLRMCGRSGMQVVNVTEIGLDSRRSKEQVPQSFLGLEIAMKSQPSVIEKRLTWPLSVAICCLFITMGSSVRAAEQADGRPHKVIVRVDGGSLVGTAGTHPGVRVFKGIPYAAP